MYQALFFFPLEPKKRKKKKKKKKNAWSQVTFHMPSLERYVTEP